MPQCYALLAACQYAGTAKALEGTSQDATWFSQLLQNDLAVPAENITLMDEAGERPPTGAAIRKALNYYAGKAEDGDSILFYFAGHGTAIQAPAGPKRALVCCDLDLLLRYDVNSIATACAEGVKFTVVADASNASELLPHAPINGAETKEVEIDNTGRKLGPQKYVKMFQAKYPNAGMTAENTIDVVRTRFPLEGAEAQPGQVKPGMPGAPGAGGLPQRSRVRRAGPLGEGVEGRSDDEEDDGDDEGRRERRRRNDEDGDARRRRRHEREDEEGRGDDEEEEEEEEGGGRRPGHGRRPGREGEEEEEGGGRRPGHGRRPGREGEEEEEVEAEGGRRRPGHGRRPDEGEECEEGEEPGEGGFQPPQPEEGEGAAPSFPGFGRPQHAPGQEEPGEPGQSGEQPGEVPEDDGKEGDEEEAPDAVAPPETTDSGVGERGVLFSASWKKSFVADGAGFTVALIKAVRQVKEAGEVTNQAVIDALMALMAESNPRMIPTLACSAAAAGEPFFAC